MNTPISTPTNGKANECWTEWQQGPQRHSQEQLDAEVAVARSMYERALQPVFVEQLPSTGNPLHDLYNLQAAENKAKNIRRHNAAIIYAWEHHLPMDLVVPYA